jgi:hypothetical protein
MHLLLAVERTGNPSKQQASCRLRRQKSDFAAQGAQDGAGDDLTCTFAFSFVASLGMKGLFLDGTDSLRETNTADSGGSLLPLNTFNYRCGAGQESSIPKVEDGGSSTLLYTAEKKAILQ